MLIDKTDFPGIASMSLNIEDDILNPYIEAAEEYDLFPLMGLSMYNILQNAKTESVTWTDWTAGVYANGIVKIHNKKVWKVIAAVSTNTEPGTIAGAADWQLQELFTFWRARLRRFLVWTTAAYFYSEHGIWITQAGIRVINNGDSLEASPEEKAILIKSAERKRNIELNKMMLELSIKNWTFDTLVYAMPTDNVSRDRQKDFGIKAIERRGIGRDRDFNINN